MEYQLNTTLNELDTYELNVNLPEQDEYTANLIVDYKPSKTSELINDSGFITSSYVGNGALTIQKNGVTIGTFTANQNTNQTVNIEADTQVNADWTATSGVAEILHKPDLTIYATNTALNEGLATKQNIISDLNDIRAGADLGATSLQPNDNITQLTNNAGYITTSALSGYATETYVNNHHDSTKVDKNNAITSATKCKITYDSKGLVTSGTDLTTSDIPDLSSAYMTLATNQTVTSKKTLSLTETVVEGGQETILNVLSTHTNDEMTLPMWTGRVKIGNKNKTFLLGVYRQTYYGSPPICGIGAHSWSNSFTEQDAAWEDIYLNPDGDKAVYIGGKDWRANTGWLKVQNSGSDYNGKVYYNKGSIASPNFQEVAVVSDLTAKENTSNKVTSISSSSTNTQYPSAKCVYDIVGNIEATLQAIRGV